MSEGTLLELPASEARIETLDVMSSQRGLQPCHSAACPNGDTTR